MGVVDVACPLCFVCDEDKSHIFLDCNFTRALWFSLPWGVCWDCFLDLNDIYDVLAAMFTPDKRSRFLKHDLELFQLSITVLLE